MIGIQGIRIKGLDIKPVPDKGTFETDGTYELISTTGTVLAKQSFNGYDGIKVEPSADTVGLLRKFMEAYKNDLNNVLGLEDDTKGGDTSGK